MKKWFNFGVQLVGFTAQVVIPTFVVNPVSYVKWGGAVAAVQAIVGMVSHYYNPDGTNARTAYTQESR